VSQKNDFEVLTEKLISMLFGDSASMLTVTESRGLHKGLLP